MADASPSSPSSASNCRPVVPPVAAYVPAVRSGNHVYVSGQLPMVDGKLPATGKVGAEVTADDAKAMAGSVR